MVRIRIEKLVPGGEGFGHLPDGRPVFVPGALPDDEVDAVELVEKRQFARAVTFRLLEPSAERRAAPCPIAERCGGCDWMALELDAQRRHKVGLLQEALRRTGAFHELAFPIELRSEGPATGYRQRVRLHFDAAGAMGYHARASHEIVLATSCLVLAPELERAVALLEAVRAGNPRAFSAFLDVEVRALAQQRSLAFRLREGARAEPELLARLQRDFVVLVSSGRRASSDVRASRWPLTESSYLLAAPGDFTQVNWHVNRLMVEELLRGVAERGLKSFLDLYTGVGNFALPLLAAGLSGLALDADASAIKSAQRAAHEQGLSPTSFVCRDVTRWLSKERDPGRFELVVTDPPRAGVLGDPRAIERLCEQSLVLCACDPVTFARDLRRFVDLGFRIERVVAFDMFPQTHHVEVLAWLDR
jgi:23S rRNA (uracil1939-C5)-methyltransferase